jgi:hypothetical protein
MARRTTISRDIKFRQAVCIICLLLFVSAVDTIPDPPAINPPGSYSMEISPLHIGGPFMPLETPTHGVSTSLGRFRGDYFSTRLALETQGASISPLPTIHHATDTSPPNFC